MKITIITTIVIFLVIHNRVMLGAHRDFLKLKREDALTIRENKYFSMMLSLGWVLVNAVILTLLITFIIIGK